MDSRLLLRVVLVAALAVSVLASAALAAEPPAGAGSAVSKAAAQIRSLPHAKKKKKKKRRKLCVVKRLVNGKLRPVYTHTYVYKFVKRNGVRTRVIRRVRVKMRARCSKACVKTKRRGLRIVTVFKKRKIKVKIVRHNRIVTVKRKRKVPVLVACPKNRSNTVLGTPVTITLLPGSTADLDFQAFTRTTGLSGSVKGYSPGKINLNSDVNFTFTSARLNIDPAAIFIDDACNGEVSASIQTNPNTYAILDSSKDSSGTLSGSNIVASQALILRVPLDLRNDDTGCHNPYLTTGYSEMKFRVVLGGKLGTSNGSLVANLRSSSQFVDADACLQLGDPKLPCSGLQIPFPFFVATHVIGRIDLGKYGTIKL
jgi:hypothetical protein